MEEPEAGTRDREAEIEAEIADLRAILERRRAAVANLSRSIRDLERELEELRAPPGPPAPAAQDPVDVAYGELRHTVLDLVGASEAGLRAAEVAAGLAGRLGTGVGPHSHYTTLRRLVGEGRLERVGALYALTSAGTRELVEGRYPRR